MENTMDEKDMAHLIFVIKQWAREPENSWFDLKFVNSMERLLQMRLCENDESGPLFWRNLHHNLEKIYRSPLTVKQKKALLNIHTKCLKQEYKGACDSCRGSAGWMNCGEREYKICFCNSNWSEDADENKAVTWNELNLHLVCPELLFND